MHLLRVLIYVCLLALAAILANCKDDESPGFFLKITKNVPRLGRRSDKEYDSYYLKNFKTIPRIGRSTEETKGNDVSAFFAWLSTLPGQLSKRMLMKPALLMEHELSVVQPVNSNTLIELLEKNAIPSDDVKFVHWKDFDRALQLDDDLYDKVISLGRKPDQRLKEDLGFGTLPSLFGNSLNERAANALFYNRGDGGGLYTGGYGSDVLHYNRL